MRPGAVMTAALTLLGRIPGSSPVADGEGYDVALRRHARRRSLHPGAGLQRSSPNPLIPPARACGEIAETSTLVNWGRWLESRRPLPAFDSSRARAPERADDRAVPHQRARRPRALLSAGACRIVESDLDRRKR